MHVVITGANRGIGLELAKRYAARGEVVTATARKPEEAAELNALAAAHPRVTVRALDVESDAEVGALAAALATTPIDLLINNAGVSSRYAGLAELDLAELTRVFQTNAVGPIRVTRALLPLVQKARGKIIHMTSRMGSIGDNDSGRAYAYRMSKAALNMAAKNMAIELAATGVISVAVHPGWVQTDMGGSSAPVSVADACAEIVALVDRLDPAASGRFFHANGSELPW